MKVILYVNDLIVLASDVIKLKVEKEFEMSDLGELHHCLIMKFEKNMEVHTNIMNQRRYIEEVLMHFKMGEYKPL